MQEIYLPVRDILCEVLGVPPDQVVTAMALENIAFADWGRIFIDCEQAFSITLHDEIIDDLHTVGDLMRVIDACLKDGPAAYTQPDDVQRQDWYYE